MAVLDGGEIQLELTESVFVMNEATWENWKESIFEEAGKRENPLVYLQFVSELAIFIDTGLPDDAVEVYDIEAYNYFENDLKEGSWGDEEK